MQKKFKFLAAGSLITLGLVISGCQEQAPAKTPEQIVQEGVAKLSSVTAYSYNMSASGDLTGPEGKPPAVVKFNFGFKGAVDMTDPQDPKFVMKVDGSGNGDADSAEFNAELRLNKTALFMSLMKLEGKGAMAVPEEFKTMFAGKWWKLPIPPEALEQLKKEVPTGGDDANLTPEQKKLKDLFQNTKFFTDLKFVGTEKVLGEDSYHYTGSLDKNAFQEFIKKVAETQGEIIPDDAELKAGLDQISMSADIYVGKDSGILNKISGALKIVGKDKTEPSGTITMGVELGDFNKAVVVEEPADALPVPLEALAGLLGGGGIAPSDDLAISTYPAGDDVDLVEAIVQ